MQSGLSCSMILLNRNELIPLINCWATCGPIHNHGIHVYNLGSLSDRVVFESVPIIVDEFVIIYVS
jgi:hypothetical protein